MSTISYNNNNDLNTKSVSVSPHAITRARTRLDLNQKNNSDVVSLLRDRLRESKFIGNVYDDEGNDALLYSTGGVGYYVSLDKTTLITVIVENKVKSPLHKQIIELHRKEIRKLTRKEQSRLRRLDEVKLKTNIEVSTLNYKIHRSRSNNAINTYKSKINKMNELTSAIENEITNIRQEKKKYAKSLVSIL